MMLYRIIRWTVGLVFLALICSGAAPSAIAQAPLRVAGPEVPQAPEIARDAAPGCASWSTAHIDCFVIGKDHNVWQLSWNSGTGWTYWTRLGYPDEGSDLAGGVAVVSRGANTLDLFVVGSLGATTNLYQRTFSGGTWGAWVNLSGPGTINVYEIACATTGPTNIECFMRGSDNHLWQRTWNSAWGGWIDLGAFPSQSSLGGLAAVTYGGGSLVVFATGSDGHAYRRFRDTTTWSAWSDDGAPPASSLRHAACNSANPDRIDCVFADANGNAWYRRWTTVNSWEAFTDASLPPARAMGIAIANYQTEGLIMLAPAEDGYVYSRSRVTDASSWSAWVEQGRIRDIQVFLPMIQR